MHAQSQPVVGPRPFLGDNTRHGDVPLSLFPPSKGCRQHPLYDVLIVHSDSVGTRACLADGVSNDCRSTRRAQPPRWLSHADLLRLSIDTSHLTCYAPCLSPFLSSQTRYTTSGSLGQGVPPSPSCRTPGTQPAPSVVLFVYCCLCLLASFTLSLSPLFASFQNNASSPCSESPLPSRLVDRRPHPFASRHVPCLTVVNMPLHALAPFFCSWQVLFITWSLFRRGWSFMFLTVPFIVRSLHQTCLSLSNWSCSPCALVATSPPWFSWLRWPEWETWSFTLQVGQGVSPQNHLLQRPTTEKGEQQSK